MLLRYRLYTVSHASQPETTVKGVEFAQRCNRFSALDFAGTTAGRSPTIYLVPNNRLLSDRFGREPPKMIFEFMGSAPFIPFVVEKPRALENRRWHPCACALNGIIHGMTVTRIIPDRYIYTWYVRV